MADVGTPQLHRGFKHRHLNMIALGGVIGAGLFVESVVEVENYAHGIAIYFMHYNFVRIYQTLRCTPAMESGVIGRLWELADIVQVLEAWEATKDAPPHA